MKEKTKILILGIVVGILVGVGIMFLYICGIIPKRYEFHASVNRDDAHNRLNEACEEEAGMGWECTGYILDDTLPVEKTVVSCSCHMD